MSVTWKWWEKQACELENNFPSMPLNPEKNPSFQRHVKEKKLINRTAARIGESFAGKQKRRRKNSGDRERVVYYNENCTHSFCCLSERSKWFLGVCVWWTLITEFHKKKWWNTIIAIFLNSLFLIYHFETSTPFTSKDNRWPVSMFHNCNTNIIYIINGCVTLHNVFILIKYIA